VNQRRHIVLVAPPWYPVPPHGYGGIELVVALLAAELRALGHRVTVLGAEGSRDGTLCLAPRSWSADLGRLNERHREVTYAARVMDALSELDQVDVVHDHTGFATLLVTSQLGMAPVVHTVHGTLREPDRTLYEALGERVGLVAISRAQRATAPHLRWLGTVHNAVDLAALGQASPAEKAPYLLCLARVCPDKGQHLAIEVARRSGHRLVLAGKVEPTPQARDYYSRCVAPALDGDRVIHLDNIAGEEKARLLRRAQALVAPIQWEEPFGLAIVEAMVSGTPAVAMRRGAAAELIDDGVTGFCVDSVDGMVDAVHASAALDPAVCAATARERFSPQVMAAGYLAAYEEAMAAVAAPLRGWPMLTLTGQAAKGEGAPAAAS